MEKSEYLGFLQNIEKFRQKLAVQVLNECLLANGQMNPKTQQLTQNILVLENLLLDEIGVPETENTRTVTVDGITYTIPVFRETPEKPTPLLPKETPDTAAEIPEEKIPEETTETVSKEILDNIPKEEPPVKEAEIPEEIPVAKEMPSEVAEKEPVPASEPVPEETVIADEASKLDSELIYDKYRLTVLSPSSGNTTDIELFVAPLERMRKSQITVPILVHVFSRGNYLTASSFDTLDAKNMLTISINGVDLLVRGSTDEQGHFVSAVVTTGRTAQLGDKMSIVSKDNHTKACSGIGHIHFTENGREFHIFPLSKENEFICMTSDSEFTDYYVCAKDYGQPRIKIMGPGQFPIELIATWSGDVFEAAIL